MALPVDLSLARVVIAPGDMLIITCDQLLTKEQVEQIKANVAKPLPDVKVAVLCGGLRAAAVLARPRGRGADKVWNPLQSDTD